MAEGTTLNTNILSVISDTQKKVNFSGSILIKDEHHILAESSYGYANRADQIKNSLATRYGIASGCKLFTAIAICQLVEAGVLSFETRLKDCLDIDFPRFDETITVHHLLTHTAGIPDYFDEEVMDDFEELWTKTPMYKIRNLEEFLPFFQYEPMKYKVEEQFHYNNAGYILLGLIIEQTTQLSFHTYVEKEILHKAHMTSSGYFELDALPNHTALGYIDFPDDKWKTNIYSLPAKGGADGGAFVTVCDMNRLWNSLLNHQLLSKKYTTRLLTPHTETNNENSFYGYGVWIEKRERAIFKYHIMGYDPGVSFHSAFYPKCSVTAVICSNKSHGAFPIMKAVEEEFFNSY